MLNHLCYRMAGIPASQQHLVWQSDELSDEQSLQECRVYNGATLRLVLDMRGGPISTHHGMDRFSIKV